MPKMTSFKLPIQNLNPGKDSCQHLLSGAYFLIRPALFKLSAEMAHEIGMLGIRTIGVLHRLRIWPRPGWAKTNQVTSPFGILDSVLGLAAGFDKNGKALWGWQALGFSFVEVGTVTPKPQEGNPRPRLFRYPERKSLVNRMGFNNDGADAVADRIRRAKKAGLRIAVGGNIGKNLSTSIEDAPRDYASVALALKDVVDYLVINVSSPNTPGLRSLQDANSLGRIVQPIRSAAPTVPLFIKVAPDQFRDFIDGVGSVVTKYNLDGVICGNTLADHDLEKGGLSGTAIFETNLLLCQTYANTRAFPFLIGVGGIGSAQDAQAYLQSGAQLIQIYSGLVFEGPQLIEDIIIGTS